MMIITIIQTLAPIILPIASAGLTWLFSKLLGSFNPAVQAQIRTYLPAVSATFGAVLASMSGYPISDGIVAGLAGTGIHQLVTQPVKAANGKK
jgi:hypothetical protein